MARKSLVSVVADDLLDQIIRGSLAIDAGLPSEADIGDTHDVSRMTVREAMKTLQAMGVVRVVSGTGSFVNPVSRWTSLAAVLRMAAAGTSDVDVAVQLLEVRRMFETGAAALAASRCTAEDLHALSSELDHMRDAHERGDVDAFVRADLAFHDIILHASGNVILGVLFEPLTREMAERRTETSRVTEIQTHAIEQHSSVLTALGAGDPEASRMAMDSHMDQTLADLRTFVLRSR
ncbi:GntR family transcriptional regulator [Cryobacterium roopkundense]|uniref:DNA-binding FadR family transcriptional regulator n=1 Tax=Cryobacterium roopkundense TaxID=1001240 RepID=A0A099JQ97_9MICO|nr:FadR/GntR family transcriptional regulator [Cryobacterium roopkundense]KGJ80346.1 GntR family transcriptional regulator [Cryobacterium roopkundense]MBB5641979.1 DNA-binding FadR family transcriptional regulator [Cryobacterium roopkundense]